MVLEEKSLDVLKESLAVLQQSFDHMPDFQGAELDADAARVMQQVAEKMQDNYPYAHPLYAGQMLKPPHPIARTAYMLSMWVNPNNHALDGGRASSEMEKEAVAEIAAMFGWSAFLGHLCGGGTMANLEALWVAGRIHPGKKIVASAMAHYTHGRIAEVLQLPFSAIAVDEYARMDLQALEQALQQGDIGTVVVTLGTTGVGSVDPLAEIVALQQKYDFRIHVDSAYGGYFTLTDNLNSQVRSAYDAIPKADSIVVDPHKHGLQPYGCGCILFKEPSVGQYYKHDSPYTYFSSAQMHLGEITLECSRAGASAVALWATQKYWPLVAGGEFAASLQQGREAALQFYQLLHHDNRYMSTFEPDLDIVIWAPKGKSCSQISALSQQCFEQAQQHHLHLALLELPVALAKTFWLEDVEYDADTVTCLRSTLMKAEHLAWLPEIKQRLDQSMTELI